MTNCDRFEYTGNSIFRGQPNHSYFDKPFEQEDCLFQCLNNIDPYFLTPEQQAQCIKLTNVSVIDPRTNKPITQLCYDYTKEEDTKIFHSPRRSIMTEKQHEIGVRVLNLLQQCLEVEEEDMCNWHRMQKTRLKEIECFQKYVGELTQKCKEQIYAPCRKLLELYKNWYKMRAIKLLKRYPQQAYNTHLGLPQVRQCKNVLSNLQVKLTDTEIVTIVGQKCCWQNNMNEELKKLNYSIGSYAEIYTNSEDLKDSLEDNLQLTFTKIAEKEENEIPYFYMPIESLLFLLTAGDYIDLPTEMFLNIKEKEDLESDFSKYIIMDLPLPARHCGQHTYQQVVQQAVTAMLSIRHTKYLNEESSPVEAPSTDSTDYKLLTLQDFMDKSTFTEEKLCKFSKTLTKWQLAVSETDMHYQIYTSLDSCLEYKSTYLKLEYKPNFGSEVLSKYEILKNLFKLKLIGATNINCLRLNVTNYQTLSEETLYARKLEHSLHSIYHIDFNQLLNNLMEFLKMLYSMPPGQYMLRYNPKFKDKLMLCSHSQEITQNTIYLEKMINSDVTNIEFMSQENFLPIDENLCNIMHLQHKILPAAFCPRAFNKQPFRNGCLFPSKQKYTLKQKSKRDKKAVLNRTENKIIRKRQYKNKSVKTKNNELEELEQEIELDRKMVIF